VFTHSEIVLFGYANSTALEVTGADGGEVWRGTLNAGEHHVLRPGAGVYHIVGTQPYATLVGDPTTGAVMGYYAMDERGRGTSKLFYTYQSSGNPGILGLGVGPRNFVVFAYQDGTAVTLKETDSDRLIWQGTLNRGQAHFEPDLQYVFLTVQASQPVSALSYSDQGYYVPAESGKFIGREFYTWAGNAGDWTHDLNVIAYTDNTTVTIRDTQSGEVLWQGTLAAGRMQTVPNVNDRQLSIETSQDAAVSVSPTTSYTSNYYHMLFAQDETGAGIGKRFYYPAIEGARLEIFAYEDDTQVEVRDGANAIAYQGTLKRGESTAFDSAHTLYTITSSRPVAALMDWGNEAGADFAPPYYAAPTATLPTVIVPPWLPLVGGGLLAAGLLGVLLARLLRARPGRAVQPTPPSPAKQRSTTPTWPAQKQPPSADGADVTHGRAKPRKR
jgi:hypothetical protein